MKVNVCPPAGHVTYCLAWKTVGRLACHQRHKRVQPVSIAPTLLIVFRGQNTHLFFFQSAMYRFQRLDGGEQRSRASLGLR
jgi:hypothetical protein